MSAVLEFPEVRLLRPLLGVRRADLRAFLLARGVAWVDDPSNVDPRFERTRLRRDLAQGGMEDQTDAAAGRVETEARANAALARTVSLSPWGWASLDMHLFRYLDRTSQRHVLARHVTTVGGADHPPPGERTARLAARLVGDTGFTGASLGRCRIGAAKAGRVMICRAARDLPAAIPARPGEIAGWDGRFRVWVPAGLVEGTELAPLGAEGWRRLSKEMRVASGLSLVVARTLPALFSGGDLIGHPMGEVGGDGGETGAGGLKIRFRPKNTLGFNGFCIA